MGYTVENCVLRRRASGAIKRVVVFVCFVCFLLVDEKGIVIPLKAGRHRPASETPLNGILLAGQCWLYIA